MCVLHNDTGQLSNLFLAINVSLIAGKYLYSDSFSVVNIYFGQSVPSEPRVINLRDVR